MRVKTINNHGFKARKTRVVNQRAKHSSFLFRNELTLALNNIGIFETRGESFLHSAQFLNVDNWTRKGIIDFEEEETPGLHLKIGLENVYNVMCRNLN